MTTADFRESVSWSSKIIGPDYMTTANIFKHLSKFKINDAWLHDFSQFLRESTPLILRPDYMTTADFFCASIQIWAFEDLTTWLQLILERVCPDPVKFLTTWLQPIFSSIYPNLRLKRPDYMTTANFWESPLRQNSRSDYMTSAFFLRACIQIWDNFWESLSWSIPFSK